MINYGRVAGQVEINGIMWWWGLWDWERDTDRQIYGQEIERVRNSESDATAQHVLLLCFFQSKVFIK